MIMGLTLASVIFRTGLIVHLIVHLEMAPARNNSLNPLLVAGTYCPCRCCLLPHPDNCKAYYLCLEHVLIQKTCEDGELFNKMLENCDYESRVYCPAPTLPPQLVFRCPKKEGLYSHLEDCGSFIQCSNWIPYTHRCPAKLHFSRKLKRCEYPSVAKCEYQVQKYIADFTTEGYIDIDSECPSRDGMFPYIGNSSMYLQCEDWMPRSRYCPPNTLYSVKRWICTIKRIQQ